MKVFCYHFAMPMQARSISHIDVIVKINIQVGYAEKIANVWAKVTEETSVYAKESS